MPEPIFKNLSTIAWEVEHDDCDCRARERRPVGLGFDIRVEQDNYVIVMFDSATGDADEAYLTNHQCETWKLVERYCHDYDRVTVILGQLSVFSHQPAWAVKRP